MALPYLSSAQDTESPNLPHATTCTYDTFVRSQVTDNMRKRNEGTGLGLVITKNLVTKMGGTIRVTSVEGAGSTFAIAASFAAASGAPGAADRVAPLDGGSQELQMRVGGAAGGAAAAAEGEPVLSQPQLPVVVVVAVRGNALRDALLRMLACVGADARAAELVSGGSCETRPHEQPHNNEARGSSGAGGARLLLTTSDVEAAVARALQPPLPGAPGHREATVASGDAVGAARLLAPPAPPSLCVVVLECSQVLQLLESVRCTHPSASPCLPRTRHARGGITKMLLADVSCVLRSLRHSHCIEPVLLTPRQEPNLSRTRLGRVVVLGTRRERDLLRAIAPAFEVCPCARGQS